MEITICSCASRPLIGEQRIALLAASFASQGHQVRLVDDLCRMAQTHAPELAAIARTRIVACHQRSVKHLFIYAGYEVADVADIRDQKPMEDVDTAVAEPFLAQLQAMDRTPGTDAWYPVIDRDRCINCHKCFDFCLFGVYSVEDKAVKVVHPENCKNNCPACARTCPKTAIIFPKYDKPPINGGEETGVADVIQVDTKALYNQALRERLAQRRGTFLIKKK